jgi:EAL domain-containing protein (putative c-di-GMP-specific phosphodiesterase class I)
LLTAVGAAEAKEGWMGDRGQIGKRFGTGLLLGLRVRRAMVRGEIVMHYQPKVAVSSGELLAVEALARWHHPRRGVLAPAEWLAGTERPWNEWRFMRYTLDCALAQARRWSEEGGLDLLMCINVTPRCCADRRLPALLAEVLERAGVPATQLQLELTEATLELSLEAIEVAEELNRMGIGLALDDFGTGHSSMERLARLPINELKIDRRFVHNQSTSPREAAIVRGAIDLGHALGLAVTAEGVETPQQLETLRRDGCDIVQGFHYAPALPAAELVAWEEGLRPAWPGPERRRGPDRRLWDRRSSRDPVGR